MESKVCSDMWNSRCVGCQRSKGVCGSRVCSDLGGSRGVGCKGYLGSRSIWKYGVLGQRVT